MGMGRTIPPQAVQSSICNFDFCRTRTRMRARRVRVPRHGRIVQRAYVPAWFRDIVTKSQSIRWLYEVCAAGLQLCFVYTINSSQNNQIAMGCGA
jgi:hypothetical protein